MQFTLPCIQRQDGAVAENRDERDYLALLDEHGPVVLALLRRLCRNHHDAEDAFQETAVRVWRGLDQRPRLRNPRGWLLTVAYRTYVDKVARRQRMETVFDDAEPPDERHAPPDVSAERAEEQGKVRDCLAALPTPLREVVALHYTGHMSLGEIATATGLPVGTVKSRLNAALGKLRELLQ